MPQVILTTSCCGNHASVTYRRLAGCLRIVDVELLPGGGRGSESAADEHQLASHLVGQESFTLDGLQYIICRTFYNLQLGGHSWFLAGHVDRALVEAAIRREARFRYSIEMLSVERVGGVLSDSGFSPPRTGHTSEGESPDPLESDYYESDPDGDDDYYGDADECEGLHDHGYSPVPIFKHGTGEPRGSTKAFFGVELEIDARRPKDRTSVQGWAGSMFYCKEDGSLNYGVELVSHPGTQAWWNGQKGAIAAMLQRLVREGWSSHTVGTCGMHIHISRRAFEGAMHLYRFLHVVYREAEFSLMISQRQPSQLRQWASLTPNRRKALKRKIGIGYYDDNRYEAVNMTGRTAEMRMFRGTLKLESFYKNLEYVWALLEFTQETTRIRSCTAFNFLAWLQPRKEKYPNLHAFTEKEYKKLQQKTLKLSDQKAAV